MAPITITTHSRRSFAEVYEILAGIPSALSGRGTDPSSLRSVFLSNFAVHLLAHITYAFLQKSRGYPDNLGNVWPPLKPSTIRRKLKDRQQREPSAKRDFLSPAQKTKWTQHYTAAFQHFRRSGIQGEELVTAARRLAWNQLTTTGSANIPINVNTGRLLQSLQPGSVSGDTYTPASPDQQAEISPSGLSLRFTVPYTSHVHKTRPLYPPMPAMRPWTRAAAASALHATLLHLSETLE